MNVPRIVVVGSVNTDMVVKGDRLPGPGETVTGGRFLMAGGGKGANQAVAAARLGAEVTLVAKVGRDVFGDTAIENFRREGIRADRILRDPQNATGVALILVDGQGENLISVASGANHALTPEEIDQAADCIRAADVLMLQLEIPLDAVHRAAQIAAEANVPVILNPAPAAPLEGKRGQSPFAGTARRVLRTNGDCPLFPDILRLVTYLTPNESEAGRLSGVGVHDEAFARQAAEQLLTAGTRHVIITLGAKGAQWTSAAGTVLIPSVAVEAVDTTAAGDAFCGGLAWALGGGTPVEQAVRQACLVGALSATRLGAQPSLPTKEELLRFAETQSRL
jgi:ribokinase